MNADKVARRKHENAKKEDLHGALRLRTDLDHTAYTFLGYSDDAKRREKVDAWMRKPDAIDWPAEIDSARQAGQAVRFGPDETKQVRLLLAEHVPL